MEPKNRGARLKQSADRNKVEPFAFMAVDGTFSATADINARTSSVDRFLSNFHKPLQRRMLFTDINDPLPPTGVIKHMLTGQIFLVGQDREDTDGTSAYERLNVLHLVSNDSSVLAEVIRYEQLDPASMVLTPVVIGNYYIALEFQSSKTQRDSDEAQTARMLFYSSAQFGQVANELCQFIYNGKVWAIRQAHYDSGFCSGIVTATDRNIVTYNLVKPVTGYDPAIGKWDFMKDAVLKPFSASLAEEDSESIETSRHTTTSTRIIYAKNMLGNKKEFYANLIVQDDLGKTFKILKVSNNVRSDDLMLTLTPIKGI